jgi:ABC-type sugar transport system permease subunit
MGYASAMARVMIVIVPGLIFMLFRLTNKYGDSERFPAPVGRA